MADLDIIFDRFSGVKLTSDNTTQLAPLDFIEAAFGQNTNGRDGGVFVEFQVISKGSGPIPKYNTFPDDVVSNAFCNHWFLNKGNGTNIFYC